LFKNDIKANPHPKCNSKGGSKFLRGLESGLRKKIGFKEEVSLVILSFNLILAK
jgi:hypothetical protein